ncbi:MAG: cytochrome C oxidase subunit IV family protein [Anaerolineae bacterium]|jgi:hypothetical protein
MDISFGLVLAIAAGLLVVAGGMGAALAFVMDKVFPVPLAEEPEEKEKELAPVALLAAYRRGIFVGVGLAVLTAVEFAVAGLLGGSAALLFVLALAKAGLIIQYYMHLDSVWSEEAHR